MVIEFLNSAAKHGFSREDAINAITDATYLLLDFDTSRVPNGSDPALAIGPSRNGDPIEVMFTYAPDRITIFHCMKVRNKILRLAQERTSDHGD